MNRRLLGLTFLCTAALLGACAKHNQPTTAISGMLSYRTPVQFKGAARLELQLTDQSVSDGPALDVATYQANDVVQLPYQYTLPYTAKNIDQNHRYTIAARIYVNDALQYATDNAIEVLTQGKGTHIDFSVIATGTGESSAPPVAQVNEEVFQGELRKGSDVTLYRAGLHEGHINWLEEDHSNGTPQPLHARYDFKGALLMRYVDGSPLAITFDDAGRPTSITKNNRPLVVAQEMNAINTARNRAALLRSHALATRESQAHRHATKNDVGG